MESIETAILTVQRQVASGNLPDSYAVEAGSGVVRAGPETRSAPSRPTSAPSQAPASDTRRAEPGTRRDAPPTGSRPTTPARAPATPAPAPPARTPVAAEPRVYPPTSTAVLGEVLPPPRAGGAGDPWAAVTEARSLLALGAGADLKALSRAKRRVALRLARADQGAVGADAVAALRAMQAQLTGAISRTQLQSIVGASGTHAPVAAVGAPPLVGISMEGIGAALPRSVTPALAQVWQLAPTQGPASDGASPLAPAYASISGQEEEDDDLTCIVCMVRGCTARWTSSAVPGSSAECPWTSLFAGRRALCHLYAMRAPDLLLGLREEVPEDEGGVPEVQPEDREGGRRGGVFG